MSAAIADRNVGVLSVAAAVCLLFELIANWHEPLTAFESFERGVFIAAATFAVVVSALLVWSWRVMVRHINADTSYWIALQTRSRPRIVRFVVVSLILSPLLAVASAYLKFWIANGFFTAVGGVCVLLVIASVTGGIRSNALR
jgi:hypothetical protein